MHSGLHLPRKVRLCEGGPCETARRCRNLIEAGADAIAIHARLPSERPRDACRWDEVATVVASLRDCGMYVCIDCGAYTCLEVSEPI